MEYSGVGQFAFHATTSSNALKHVKKEKKKHVQINIFCTNYCPMKVKLKLWTRGHIKLTSKQISYIVNLTCCLYVKTSSMHCYTMPNSRNATVQTVLKIKTICSNKHRTNQEMSQLPSLPPQAPYYDHGDIPTLSKLHGPDPGK